MATFHQEGQRVHNQVNGEHVHVGTATSHDVQQMIDDLVRRIRNDDSYAGHSDDAVSHLEAARSASDRGDRKNVVVHLKKAAEIGGPVAAIITSVLSVLNGVTG